MNLEEIYYTDYPSEPIGGTNPYYKCSACGASEPYINGKLENHFGGCLWVKKKKKELAVKELLSRIDKKATENLNDVSKNSTIKVVDSI